MEQKTYNQQQWLRSARSRAKCRICKKPIIWMRTIEGRAVAVDPLKLVNSDMGVRILGEDGITQVNNLRKVGWRHHECAVADRHLGGSTSIQGSTNA